MKTQQELMSENYLNKKQISRLLGITPGKARELYAKADEVEKEMEFRLEKNKVRTSTVLRLAGLTLNELKERTTA